MGPDNTKKSSLKCDFLIITYNQNLVLIVKNTKCDQKTVSFLCVKTKSGAHKQLTFYFQMRIYFCRHLHSSLISMLSHQRQSVSPFISNCVSNFLFYVQFQTAFLPFFYPSASNNGWTQILNIRLARPMFNHSAIAASLGIYHNNVHILIIPILNAVQKSSGKFKLRRKCAIGNF